MNWKHWCLVIACAGFMAVGCGDDDNPTDPGDGNGNGNGTPTTTPPRDWQGTWVGTVTTIDRDVAKAFAVTDTTVETDTVEICEKGLVDLETPNDCVKFIGDDSVYVDCDTTAVFVDGEDTCTVEHSFVGSGKRTGTTFTLTGRETTIATGDCPDDVASDVDIISTYTRTVSTPADCGDDYPEEDDDTTGTGGGNTGEFIGLGDYEARVRIWICGSATPITDTRDTSSVCPGDSASDFDDDFEQDGIECDIDIGTNTIDVDCEGEITDVETGCTITTSNSYEGTFDDDSYDMTGSGTITATGSGEFCDFIPDQCFEFEINGRRLSTTPSDCASPKVSPSGSERLDPATIAELVQEQIEAAVRDLVKESR